MNAAPKSSYITRENETMKATIYGDAHGPFKAKNAQGQDMEAIPAQNVIRDLYDHLRSLGFSVDFEITLSEGGK